MEGNVSHPFYVCCESICLHHYDTIFSVYTSHRVQLRAYTDNGLMTKVDNLKGMLSAMNLFIQIMLLSPNTYVT